MSLKITQEPFNEGIHEAKLFTLSSDEVCVKITNYGAAIVSIMMNDGVDIVLGFDDLKGYLADKGNIYYGATVGRCANRIAKGEFTLNGVDYKVAINNGPNHLHGGIDNFSCQYFDSEIIGDDTLKLTYHSKDMEEGYPGNLTLSVTYKLKGNVLSMDYDATSDKDTICNITNHTYYNLKGEGKGTANDLELMIKADEYAGCDETGLALDVSRVEMTPFDFREFHTIGERINEDNLHLKNGNGYDHHFVFNDKKNQVILRDPESKRSITFSSSQEGVQIYTANWFNHEYGKGNSIYEARDGVAIEFQNIPDAIHRLNKTSILKANELYHHSTTLTFEREN